MPEWVAEIPLPLTPQREVSVQYLRVFQIRTYVSALEHSIGANVNDVLVHVHVCECECVFVSPSVISEGRIQVHHTSSMSYCLREDNVLHLG